MDDDVYGAEVETEIQNDAIDADASTAVESNNEESIVKSQGCEHVIKTGENGKYFEKIFEGK